MSDLSSADLAKQEGLLSKLGEPGSKAIEIMRSLGATIQHLEDATASLQFVAKEVDGGKLQYSFTLEVTQPRASQSQDPKLIQIRDLEFSTRTKNILDVAGVLTIGELIEKFTEQHLRSLKNCGNAAIEEIKMKLKGLGLQLRAD